MKPIFILALAIVASVAQGQTINAVYFGQTHVQKATDLYFGLLGNREALIKVHVTAPGSAASPACGPCTNSGSPGSHADAGDLWIIHQYRLHVLSNKGLQMVATEIG